MQPQILLLETARKLAEQHHFDGPALRECMPYLQEFAGKKFVLKIGGSILNDMALIPVLVDDIVFLKRLDINIIIVHGGAKHIDARMRSAGLTPEKIDGLRVTSRAVLDVAHQAFREISGAIKAAIDERGYLGKIFDRSSGLVVARQKRPELQYVGEPIAVNLDLLAQPAAGTIPIVPSVTAGDSPDAPGFNVNADEVASVLAAELQAEKLILMTDVDGVKDSHGKIISTLTAGQVEELIRSGVISDGMVPKVRACLAPLRHGVHKSHIIRGDADSFINEILTEAGVGTQFVSPEEA
ncbi:MAG: acetylglutamate kinase [Gammaproteobacteria bacterium]